MYCFIVDYIRTNPLLYLFSLLKIIYNFLWMFSDFLFFEGLIPTARFFVYSLLKIERAHDALIILSKCRGSKRLKGLKILRFVCFQNLFYTKFRKYFCFAS